MSRLLTPTTLSAIAFLVFWGAMWIWAADSAFSGRDGPLAYNPLFYPRALIVLGIVLTCGVLLDGIRTAAAGDTSQNGGSALIAAALSAGFMLTLKPLGFFVSSAVFVAAFALTFGYRRPLVLCVTWAVTASFVWLVFTEGLQAPLPDWPIFLD